MSILELILRFFLFIFDVALWWDVIQLILPIRHYHGEPLSVRFRGAVLLALLVLVVFFHSVLGAVLTWILALLLIIALVVHCIVLRERSE